MPCQCVASDRVPVAVLCVYVSIYESVCVCGGGVRLGLGV
jgi:hypothetical protein